MTKFRLWASLHVQPCLSSWIRTLQTALPQGPQPWTKNATQSTLRSGFLEDNEIVKGVAPVGTVGPKTAGEMPQNEGNIPLIIDTLGSHTIDKEHT